MNPPVRHIAIIAFAYLISFVVGVIGVANNDWFGSGDLTLYAVYCVPFAIGLWISSSLWFKLTHRWPIWIAAPLGFLIGAVVGFGGTYFVALFLGPWLGTMSVPMLNSWCVSAAFIFPAVYVCRRDGIAKRSLVLSALFASMGMALFFGFSPMWSLATDNQHLATAFFRYVPGEGELRVDREPDWLTEEDRKLLVSSGLRGTLECFRSGGSNSTDWPKAKAFVIFTDSLSETIRLSQPKHTTVLYVQRGTEFVMLPEDAKTLERAIEFYKDQGEWHYWVEQSSGAKSGGGLNF